MPRLTLPMTEAFGATKLPSARDGVLWLNDWRVLCLDTAGSTTWLKPCAFFVIGRQIAFSGQFQPRSQVGLPFEPQVVVPGPYMLSEAWDQTCLASCSLQCGSEALHKLTSLSQRASYSSPSGHSIMEPTFATRPSRAGLNTVSSVTLMWDRSHAHLNQRLACQLV